MQQQYGKVYAIKNQINDKFYIGQTTIDLEKRIKAHFKPSNECIKLRNAVKKYGRKNFIYGIVDYAESKNELDRKEAYYIKKFNSINNGYNLREGGSYGKHSKKTKLKISKAISGKNHPNYGKKLDKKIKRITFGPQTF